MYRTIIREGSEYEYNPKGNRTDPSEAVINNDLFLFFYESVKIRRKILKSVVNPKHESVKIRRKILESHQAPGILVLEEKFIR